MEEIDRWYLELEDIEKYELLESIYTPEHIMGDLDEMFLLLDKRIKRQVYQENKDLYSKDLPERSSL